MTIEEVLEITNRVEIIDGEDVYILEKEMHEGLEKLRRRINLEKEEYIFAMLNYDVEFICNHSDFAIAFRPLKRGKWLPCLIYKYQGEWRRVALQYVNCIKCDWIGNAASPNDPDLYITMENRFEILNKMAQLPFLKCPKCGSGISTRAIWVEDRN